MKVVCAIVLISALAGCTQARFRGHECDSMFYGQYQSMGEPKALAFAIPAADPHTTTNYDTRCWARAASGRVPPGMSAEQAMNEVTGGVLRDCNEYNKENNSPRKAHQLDCRIAAKNAVWEPWVNELRAADARERGDSDESFGPPAAATVTGVAAASVISADDNLPQDRPLPNFSSPPISSVSNSAPASWETQDYKSGEVKLFGFNDAFNWCPSPGNWCNKDRIIGIKHPQTGQLIGRLAIYLRPQEVSGSRLGYTLQINNESFCKIVVEGFQVTQDDEVLGVWAATAPYIEPAGTLTIAESVTFPEGVSSNAVVSISGRAEDCQL